MHYSAITAALTGLYCQDDKLEDIVSITHSHL